MYIHHPTSKTTIAPASDPHDKRQSQAGTRTQADQNGFHSSHRFVNFVLIGGFQFQNYSLLSPYNIIIINKLHINKFQLTLLQHRNNFSKIKSFQASSSSRLKILISRPIWRPKLAQYFKIAAAETSISHSVKPFSS